MINNTFAKVFCGALLLIGALMLGTCLYQATEQRANKGSFELDCFNRGGVDIIYTQHINYCIDKNRTIILERKA